MEKSHEVRPAGTQGGASANPGRWFELERTEPLSFSCYQPSYSLSVAQIVNLRKKRWRTADTADCRGCREH